MQHVAALLHLQRLRQDPRQLGNAFAQVLKLLQGSDGPRGADAAARWAAAQQPSGASPSDMLRDLEQPLRQAVDSMSAKDTLRVLSAWARAHPYAPPSDLAALVTAQLQRVLGTAPAAAPAPAPGAAEAPRRAAAAAPKRAASSSGSSSGSSSSGGSSGSSIGSGGGSGAQPANAPEPSTRNRPSVARTWQEAFVPTTGIFFRQMDGSGQISSSYNSRSGGSAGGADSGAGVVPADTSRLVAMTAAVSSLADIAARGPEQARIGAAALERIAPAAVSLLHAELQRSHSGGDRLEGAPHAAEASAAADHVLALLEASSRVPQTPQLQSSLQQPLLQATQSMVPGLDAARLLRVLDALGDMEESSRRQAAAAAAPTRRGGGASGLFDSQQLPLDAEGQLFVEDAWQPQSGAGTAGRRHASSRAPAPLAGARATPAPRAMAPTVTNTLQQVLAAATQRLEELAPQLSPEQVATAAAALGRVCGSHHKFACDGLQSAVPLMTRPLAAMADAVVARPASLPVPRGVSASIAGAYARLMANNTPLFNRLAADALAWGIESLTPGAAAALAYAFAATNTPHPQLMAAISAHARPRLGGFSQLQLCNLLWSCAVLRHDDPGLLGEAQRLVAAWPLHQLHWTLMLQLLQVHNLYALLHDPRAAGDLHGEIQRTSSSSGSSSGSRRGSRISSGGGGSGGGGTARSRSAPLFALPDWALPEVRRVVARDRDPPRMTQFHESVLRTLQLDLGLPARAEVPILQGTASVDAVVAYRGALVAVESDGPWHYTRASPQRRNGKSVLRDRTLEAAGLVPVPLSARDWVRMAAHRRPAFLRARLDEAVAAHWQAQEADAATAEEAAL
ncbi:hypothetical protein Rsub_10835 [Raphidocelis subcapitata]|uniref:RAP domain-containing protein n=1 Tax=Raphidocelis subcapitata TaxID=307507 RepID=A0A2V0PEY7_9CHLO|nr:hypothetical protein Rsub_10835 [Raphidocelis subcapitata]|eukprot:GBF98089.1 hypothetical protein Rsub_10835 [Raphidocelis subcapitata]